MVMCGADAMPIGPPASGNGKAGAGGWMVWMQGPGGADCRQWRRALARLPSTPFLTHRCRPLRLGRQGLAAGLHGRSGRRGADCLQWRRAEA